LATNKNAGVYFSAVRKIIMPEASLTELLERNDRHADSLPDDYFDDVQSSQEPAVVSVCCSDSRVSQEGMWSVDDPGWLFTVGNIGNQAWDSHDGERVPSGDLLYPIQYTDTNIAAVVGHTGCGAVTAALESVRSEKPDELAPGIEARIDPLRPVIESGLNDDRISEENDSSLVNQLVEYNVDRQVEFLRAAPAVPETVTVLGFVYDFQEVYGEVDGRCYLVNHDGRTELEQLREAVPDEFESHVHRLL
jgi:carbonic anhydrase